MKFTVIASLACLLLAGCVSSPQQNIDSKASVSPGVSEMSPAEARPAVEAAYSQLVDVRQTGEFAAGHAYRARNIPLSTLVDNLDKLERNEPVYLICQTSNRSREAAKILTANGFERVVVISGGTDAWRAAGLPMETGPSSSNEAGIDERTRAALLSALKDERKAEANYNEVLTKFPGSRPFVNIIGAEKTHQEELLQIFNRYGLNVPVNEFAGQQIEVPETLGEACRKGIAAEKDNIAMYEGFLSFVKEADIRNTFVRLQAASRDNHLPAFTRCAEGSGREPGRGPGTERVN